jgi:hypothetical protein
VWIASSLQVDMVLSNYWAWEAKASDLRYCVKIIEQNSIILLIAEFNKYILLAVVIFFRIVTKSSWNQKKNLKLSEKVDNEAKTEKGTYKFHDRVMDIGTYITYLLIASLSIRVLKICICTIFTGNLRTKLGFGCWRQQLLSNPPRFNPPWGRSRCVVPRGQEI